MTENEKQAIALLQLITDRAFRVEQMPSTELFVQKVPAALITKARAVLGSIQLEREAKP